MRPHRLVAAAAAIVLASGSALAQDWTEFVSKEDRFTTNFPGTPVVKESTYRSQFGADLPARTGRRAAWRGWPVSSRVYCA